MAKIKPMEPPEQIPALLSDDVEVEIEPFTQVDARIGIYRGVEPHSTVFGPTFVHVFEADNTHWGAWSQSILDRLLPPMVGHKVKVGKTGQIIRTSAGRSVNEWLVTEVPDDESF